MADALAVPTAPTTFTAFHRTGPGRPWQKVLDAPTEDAAWTQLLALRLCGDLTVCVAGRDPNQTRAVSGRRML